MQSLSTGTGEVGANARFWHGVRAVSDAAHHRHLAADDQAGGGSALHGLDADARRHFAQPQTLVGGLDDGKFGDDALAEHYSTLRRALVVARRLAVRGIVQQSELALYSVLFETQDGNSLEAFLDSSIGCLLAHDQKRGSALAATLLCYFDCNRNARLVAKRLNIHVNTVRQRLALIEDMLGHLGNPTRMLEIHVALRLWGMSRKNEDPNP